MYSIRGPDKRPLGQKATRTKGHWTKGHLDEIFTLYYVPFSVVGADYTGG